MASVVGNLFDRLSRALTGVWSFQLVYERAFRPERVFFPVLVPPSGGIACVVVTSRQIVMNRSCGP